MRMSLSRKKGALFAALLISLVVVYAISRRPLGDYSDPEGPFTEGNHADTPAQFDGTLRVVSWNLYYADQMEQILTGLETSDELRNADILLLQELDSEAVEALSKKLGYNYIYYPAVLDHERQLEYGNAILSKGPLREPKKVVLPNSLPGWFEDRNAARALTTIGDQDILVYSVHLDNVWMDPQGTFLVDEVKAQPYMTILGGDFNTWRSASIANLERGLNQIGMERLGAETGYTFSAYGWHPTLDHIFTEEGLKHQAGVFRQTEASDHFPIWADIILGDDQ